MSWTHPEKILADLVAIPSISENRAANNDALNYIADFLQTQGMHTERLSYTEAVGNRPPIAYDALVATTQPHAKPRVMLSAHVDVVPAPDDLFALRAEGDKLIGRGVIDMKGEIAAFMESIATLNKSGRLHEHSLGVTITTNEEIGGKNTKKVIDDGFTADVVVLPDAAANWQIERVAKGAWTVTISALGKTAHGARPWEGDSASFRLLDFLKDARASFRRQNPETDTLNISLLKAGEAQNQIPAAAEATLDIRVISHQSQRRVQKRIEQLCAKHGVTWQLKAHFPPLEHVTNNPYFQAYKESVKSVVGVECPEVISTGASDAVYYSERGIPCIVSRPPGGDQHADSEWLSRKGLAQYIEVLGHFIATTCKKA